MKTVLGALLDRDGQARKRWHVEDPATGAWETRTRCWATPSRQLRRRQASHISVDLEHDPSQIVGEIVHLEFGPGDKVWAVAHVSDELDPPPGLDLFWSPVVRFDPAHVTDVQIDAVGIVQHPAQLGIRHAPLQILNGGCEWRGAVARWTKSELNGYQRGLCERACSTHVLRERSQPLVVHDAGLEQGDLGHVSGAERVIAATLSHDLALEADDPHWQSRPLRRRPGGRILGVY